jgi:hypothetical protein
MTDLERQIISLLKRGPYMRHEIIRYCRPHNAEDVDTALQGMNESGKVRLLPFAGLYELIDAA